MCVCVCALPRGRSFSSGSEDGFVRIHHMDPDYEALGEERELDDAALDKFAEEAGGGGGGGGGARERAGSGEGSEGGESGGDARD